MDNMPRITFSAMLDWFVEVNADRWLIHVQASQFDAKEYIGKVNEITGFLVLNISGAATRNFDVSDTGFSFNSRMNGKEVYLEIPYTAVFAGSDPVTGAPNLFPYFEDKENGLPVVKLPPKQYINAFQDGLKIPSLEDMKAIFEKPSNVIKGDFSHYKGKTSTGPMASIGKPPEETLPKKIEQRHWRVIQGGKSKVPTELPFVDVAYRAKRDAREAHELLEMTKAAMKPSATVDGPKLRELRSDGADGISSHFPDLDVSKCVFHVKQTERPSWMTVIQGDKA